MKYKVLTIAVCIVIIVVAIFMQDVDIEKNRYHQHKETVEKPVCSEHDDSVFCTHLPLLSITTDEQMPAPYLDTLDSDGHFYRNYEMVGASVALYDSATHNNHLTDAPSVSERGLIRVRGASSRKYDKKGYLLKFKEDDLVTGKKVSLCGMTPDTEWVLHGPFLDKTLIRNYICLNLAGEIMEYAPNVRFCEAFLNGDYIGVYMIIEKIKYNSDGRVKIEKTNPKIKTTSYIVEVDRMPQETSHYIENFLNYSYITAGMGTERRGYYNITYPGMTLTQDQKAYIEADISGFEKALYSYDFKDSKKGYRAYIDIDSFVDYFLINEFTLNYDAMGLSTYLYKDIGGKMKLCVWDFNSSFDYYEYSVVSPETFSLQDSMWYAQLFKDKRFVDKVVSRYHELRKTYFNEEYMNQYIDEAIAYLGPAVERNYDKWGYSFSSIHEGVLYDYLYPHERNPRNYDEAVKQLKDCIADRIEHMDSHIDRLYTICHSSMNKNLNKTEEK